jgi:predicted DNA-binding protein
MGRPPLNLHETKIRISPETKKRIADLVGNYKISAFIREAIENELAKREAEMKKEK